MVNCFQVVLLCSTVFSSFAASSSNPSMFSLPKALTSVVANFNHGKPTTVDIVILGGEKELFDNVIRDIMLHKKQHSFKLTQPTGRISQILHNSVVFLIASKELFSNLGFQHSQSDVLRSIQILIYCHGATQETFQALDIRASTYQFMSILLYGENVWSLFAYFFHLENGKVTQLREINTFSSETRSWTKNKFISGPTKNFQSYSFQVVLRNRGINQIFRQIDWKKTGRLMYVYSGIVVRIVDAIAEHFNFSVSFNPELDNHTTVYPRRVGYLYIDYLPIHSKQNCCYILTSYESSPLKYLVPPGELYSGFDKLILAFDLDTWIWILITFTCSFVTITIVSYMPHKVQTVVFGSQSTTPSLNIAVAFFGLGQMTLPRKSFGRFLLMAFILYSLIIRTAYQGASFEILQKEVVKKPIQSVEELIQKNYSMYAAYDFDVSWGDIELTKRFVAYSSDKL